MEYKEILDSCSDDVVGLLRELVSFQSVKAEAADGQPFGEEVHKAYACMLAKAERDGFETFDADGYGGHIEWAGAKTDERGEIIAAAGETLGILVHLDVVPAGNDWAYDPWAGEITEGRIYGRGTADNKGAAAAVYYAMKALKESGYVPAKNVRLILGLDEETGWSGLDKYFEQAPFPDFGFAPDADFPVVNGEKGMILCEIARKFESGRAAGLCLRSISGGNAPNMVPDRCRAILVYEEEQEAKGVKSKKNKAGKVKTGVKDADMREKSFSLVREAVLRFREKTNARIVCKGVGNALEIAAQGVSAHGAVPENGLNAISVMMDFLRDLPLANEDALEFVGFYHKRIGYETDGKGLGIAMSDKISGSLTVNTGMIDLGREAAILTVNIRYPVSKSEDDVYDALRTVLDENGLGVVKLPGSMDPLYYAPDDPFIKLLMEVYRENTGDERSTPITMGGASYARSMPGAVAFGMRFPGEEETMHKKDEYIRIDSLIKAAHIYADTIFRLTRPD